MQQPTGGIDMMTACNQQTRAQVSCEKISLLRHAFPLPETAHSYPSQSSVGQSLPVLPPVTCPYRYKLGNKALYSLACRLKKQRRDD
jgi:hypothetical protein